jgi:hypothetical protein
MRFDLDPILRRLNEDRLPPLTHKTLVWMGVGFGISALLLILLPISRSYVAPFVLAALVAVLYVLRKTVPMAAHVFALALLAVPPLWYLVTTQWRGHSLVLVCYHVLLWYLMCCLPVQTVYHTFQQRD